VPGLAKFAGCPDTDMDGVEDANDRCPNTPTGTPVDANGCPLDSDGDRVPDNLDKCPNTPAGTPVDANGCPLDADGDGVADNLDKCPNTPRGIEVDATGCPTDNDKDGVPNSIDKCPDTPGPAFNNGCPEVKEETKKRLNFATRGIFFEFGKATLRSVSFPKLDEIVSIINEYPDYNLRLGGHTDAIGSDAANLVLSQERIDAVKSYLVSKGVSEERLEAKGFGETKPIASNKTEAGRAQNRRVEMELYLK
jgi:outer membrane protein OmpA-like peptidoglycan-associated protein